MMEKYVLETISNSLFSTKGDFRLSLKGGLINEDVECVAVTAGTVKITVVREMTPCSTVENYDKF
jgi:hypothetical protein